MKKMIASMALVGLASLAFGQDAKPAPALVLSGSLDTGVTVLANGVDKASLGLWGEDAGINGGRLKLIGKYENGDFLSSFETRWDGLLNGTDSSKFKNTSVFPGDYLPVYFKHAYAQAQFFDKMVLMQVGLVKEESTKTGGNKNFKYASEVPGAVVVVKPVADLALQAFIAPAIGQGSTTAEQVANFADTQTGLSAAYTAKGIARVAAGVSLYNSKFNGYVPNKAYAGVNLYLVPNLTATVEGALEGLNDGALKGTTTVVETLGYNFKDLGLAELTVNFVAYQILYGEDVKTKDSTGTAIAQNLSLRIQPSVSYAVDSLVTANLGVAYQSGAVVLTDGYTADLGKAGVGIPTASTAKSANINNNNLATFELKPSVKLALSKTQSLSFLYAYSMSVGSDDVVYLSNSKDAKSLHTFQTAYTYSF